MKVLKKCRVKLAVFLSAAMAAGTLCGALPVQQNEIYAEDRTAFSGKLYIAGDSIADGLTWSGYNGDAVGWGDVIGSLYDANVTVDNQAKMGDSSKSFYYDYDNDGDADGRNYLAIYNNISANDYVIISFGHNDGPANRNDVPIGTDTETTKASDTEGTFQWYLKDKFVEPALAAGAVPILMTPVVRCQYDSSGKFYENDYHLEYGQAVRDLAAEYAEKGILVPLIDAQQYTYDLYSNMTQEEASSYHATNDDGSKDSTHYNQKGAERIAKFVADTMTSWNLGISDYLINSDPSVTPTPAVTTAPTPTPAVTTAPTPTPAVTAAPTATPTATPSAGTTADGLVYTVTDSAVTITGYTGTGLQVVIPETIEEKPVTTIAASAFYNSAITSVTIPGTVTLIDKNAFYYATKLTSVVFEDGDEELTFGSSAFNHADALTEITIPARATTFQKEVFKNDGNLTTVTFCGLTPPDLNSKNPNIFLSTGLTTVYVPCGTVDAYNAAGLENLSWYSLSPAITVKHSLTLESVPAKEATLEETGSEAYYRCTQCGKLFADAEGTQEITAPAVTPMKDYAEVSAYIADGVRTAPVRDGYVFAGWFTDESCQEVYEAATGVAYAKFVDEKVLVAGVQYAAGDNGTGKVRMVSSVSDLNLAKVGFVFEATGKSLTTATTKVYQSITGGGAIYAPSWFSSGSNYIFAAVVRGIPADQFDTALTVTPYWTTLDGTTVTGNAKTFTVNEIMN